MLSDAFAALGDVFSAPFRTVLLKSVGLTLAALVGLWVLIWLLLSAFVVYVPWEWLQTTLQALGGIVIALGLVFLVAPVTSLVAGFFLDDIAERVERGAFPSAPPGRPLPLIVSLGLSLKFFGAVVLANFLALVLLLVPGVNLVAFLLANGYLLGREYFELAAFRHRPIDEARRLRRRHGGHVFAAGLIIAGFVALPFINLATPLFATAFMVRLHKRLGGRHNQAVLAG